MTMKPIPDRAEVSLDFPDKAYMGAFGQGAKFEAHARADQVMLKLVRDGEEKRVVELHLHLALVAEMLDDLGREFESIDLDEAHRERMAAAARRLADALERRTTKPV